MKVLLVHIANKPTATVVTMKPSARIHRMRGEVATRSVWLLLVLLLSFPGAGPRASRENNTDEDGLRQVDAGVPGQTLLEPSRGGGEGPEPCEAGGNSDSRFCSLRAGEPGKQST